MGAGEPEEAQEQHLGLHLAARHHVLLDRESAARPEAAQVPIEARASSIEAM